MSDVPVSYTAADVMWAGQALHSIRCHNNLSPCPAADSHKAEARAVLSALASAGRDYAAGVAEGRLQVAEELSSYALNYPPEIFPPDSDSRDAIGGTAMRHAYLNAARIAEGSTE